MQERWMMEASQFIKQLLGTFFFFAIIFLSAGRIDYLQGLIYVSIGLIMMLLNYTVLSVDPELLQNGQSLGKTPRNGIRPSWDCHFLLQFQCIS